jgi:hypothetical protein
MMDSHFRRRPSHGVVVAYLALFVALGGTSIAAKSALDGDSIKKRSIPGNRLKKNGVGTKEVKGLLAKDFKAGQLPAGAQGATGPQGPGGAQGPTGVSGLQQVFKTSAADTTTPKTATATCPAGKRAIGAGATHDNSPRIVIDQIQPTDENMVPGGVTVSATQSAPPTTWSVTAFVQCANVSP